MTATALDTNPVTPIPVSKRDPIDFPDTPEGLVDYWVAQDAQFDESEWRTAEEMEECLLEAIDFTLTPEEARRIVAKHAPNAPHIVDAKVATPAATPVDTPKVTPKADDVPPCPPELAPLVQSGTVFLKDGIWSINK